jgi:hypothetical protein
VSTLEKPTELSTETSEPAELAGFVYESTFTLFDKEGVLQSESMYDIQRLIYQYARSDTRQIYVGYEPWQREIDEKDERGNVIGKKWVDVSRPGPDGVKAFVYIREGAQRLRPTTSELGELAIQSAL